MKELTLEEQKLVNGGSTVVGFALFKQGVEPASAGGSAGNDYVFSGYSRDFLAPKQLSE